MIVLDGLDGVGKSATAAALAYVAAASGREVVVLRPEFLYYRAIALEPRLITDFGTRLDYGLKGAWIASETTAKLGKDTIVICDRYVDSIIAVYTSLNTTDPTGGIVTHPSAYRAPEVPVLLKCSEATRYERLRSRVCAMSPRKRRAAFTLAPEIEWRLAAARDWFVIKNDDLSIFATAEIIFSQLIEEEESRCKRY